MELTLTGVVMWTCVGAFVAVVIAGLLALFGIWRPPSDDVTQWLKKGVIFPVVGAVVGFAALQFKGGEDPPPDDDTEIAETEAQKAARLAAEKQVQDAAEALKKRKEEEAAEKKRLAEEEKRETDEKVAANAELEAKVRLWAEGNLGKRPAVDRNFNAEYPKCVSNEEGQNEPRSCLNALNRHHFFYIKDNCTVGEDGCSTKAFYNIKAAYDAKLLYQDKYLRSGHGGLTIEETPYFAHIKQEIEYWNDPGDGELLIEKDRAEARILRDIRQMESSIR